MRALSTIISFLFILGIKSAFALFECHPHKVVCDKNCGMRYGSMTILTKLCKAACSVSQCLIKNNGGSVQGLNANANINKPSENPSLRQVNKGVNNDIPRNVQIPTTVTPPTATSIVTPLVTPRL